MNQVKAADKDSKYVGINRLLGYSYYEIGKYDKAEQLLTNFFSNHDTLKILAEDYIYLGKIQEKLGSDSLSMAKYDSMSRSSYLMAFQMDSTKEGVIKEIADSLYNQKRYDEAGFFYFARAKSTNLAADYFYATRADYLGGNYVRGMEAAQGIINKLPDELAGHLWLARNAALLDTINKGAMAVPLYEMVITKGNIDKAKNGKDILEALNWLTVYNINIKQDYVKAQSYNDQALEIDANNEQVMKLFNFLTDVTTNPPKKSTKKG